MDKIKIKVNKQEMTSNSWINLEEFLPSKDTFVVKMLPVDTKKETESGLIIATSTDSVIEDRPNYGIIVTVGPESTRKVGEHVYVQKAMGYDLKMIRKEKDVDYNYVLLYDDAIIGNRI